MATSETPKRMPAAAPSMTPWWWSGAPRCLPVISSAPKASMPASKAIMAGTEKVECESGACGSVTPSSSRPSAVMPTPHHWRAPTSKPNTRSARTASITTPVESTAWTTDSGAKASAATCRIQAPTRDAHADGEPAAPEEVPDRLDRSTDVDAGSRAGAAVLVEEAQLRQDGAAQSQDESEVEGHSELKACEVKDRDGPAAWRYLGLPATALRVTGLWLTATPAHPSSAANSRGLRRRHGAWTLGFSESLRPGMRIRPLLLVDVDGVISLFGFEAGTPPPGRLTLMMGVPHLRPAPNRRTAESAQAAFDCAWCTAGRNAPAPTTDRWVQSRRSGRGRSSARCSHASTTRAARPLGLSRQGARRRRRRARRGSPAGVPVPVPMRRTMRASCSGPVPRFGRCRRELTASSPSDTCVAGRGGRRGGRLGAGCAEEPESKAEARGSRDGGAAGAKPRAGGPRAESH